MTLWSADGWQIGGPRPGNVRAEMALHHAGAGVSSAVVTVKLVRRFGRQFLAGFSLQRQPGPGARSQATLLRERSCYNPQGTRPPSPSCAMEWRCLRSVGY